jgi:uncharacterized membrane protein
MANKILGLVLAVIGLIVMGLSFLRDALLGFLPSSIDKNDVLITGIIIVIVGAVLLYGKQGYHGKVKQSHEEVPIYEGEGKHRKIVGYKKEGK